MLTTLFSRRSQLTRNRVNRVSVIRESLAAFLFSADSDRWVALLRIGLGFQVALFCLSLRNDWNDLFAGENNGFISRDLAEAILTLQNPLVPRLGWLVACGSYLGLTEETVLFVTWICLLGAACCLLLGFCCRTSAIIAWFLHLCAVKSGDFVAYGMDNFTTIGLFYLMVAPLPDHYALDWKLWRPRRQDPRLLGFQRRVLQIHMCLIYFFGGITKCLGQGWWTGESMWRALTRPPFNLIPLQLLISWEAVLPFLGIAVCLIETGYPILIWWKRTRFIWLVCVLGMDLAIGLTMGLYLFSVIMIVLNVSAFGPGSFARQSESFRLRRQEAVV
jgi:Vitamin K-dependent gamma-carboxylase